MISRNRNHPMGRMNATVHVNGIRWEVKTRGGITEHQGIGRQRIPSFHVHTIPHFVTVNSCEIECAINVCIGMGEIHPATNRK